MMIRGIIIVMQKTIGDADIKTTLLEKILPYEEF